MYSNHLHYLPTQTLLYLLAGGLLLVLVTLLEIGILSSAYRRLGLPPRVAMLVLLASLVGSYLNIPVARLPEAHVVARAFIDGFGMSYLVPQVVDWPGTILAVNVGGALIPALLSIYLVVTNRLFFEAAIATAIVAIVVHRLATPIPGVGIAMPLFWPPVLAAIAALVLSRRYAAPARLCRRLARRADRRRPDQSRQAAEPRRVRSPRSAARELSTECFSPAWSRSCCRGSASGAPRRARRFRAQLACGSLGDSALGSLGSPSARLRARPLRASAAPSARLRPATIRSRSSRGCAGPSG